MRAAGEQTARRPARDDASGLLPAGFRRKAAATTSGTTALVLQMISPVGNPQLRRTVVLVVADSKRWHFQDAD
jgi:hypothetical protein